MVVFESAVFWIIIAAASEIIALSPLKDNSIIQLVLHALESIKGGKKELSNIPDDGQWIWRFNTCSDYERVHRYIQERKFYATLPHKLDQAEDEFHKAQPKDDVQWDTIEVGSSGKKAGLFLRPIKPSDTDD